MAGLVYKNSSKDLNMMGKNRIKTIRNNYFLLSKDKQPFQEGN